MTNRHRPVVSPTSPAPKSITRSPAKATHCYCCTPASPTAVCGTTSGSRSRGAIAQFAMICRGLANRASPMDIHSV